MPNSFAIGLACLIAVLAVREVYIFRYLPALSQKFSSRGDRKKAREILKRVATSRPFFGQEQRLTCIYKSSILLSAEKEYRQASTGFTLLLKILERGRGNRTPRLAQKVPGLEADLHRRLADCLEALGLADEANAHRLQADAAIRQTPGNVVALLAQGRLLEREGRYAEARQAYESALNANPPPSRKARIELLAQLSTCCLNTSNVDDVVRYSEEALSLNPAQPYLGVAQRMAVVGYNRTGRFDDAERMARAAYKADIAAGNKAGAAESLATLSLVQSRQGKLDECIATSEESSALTPKGNRTAMMVQSSAHKAMGRWSDARHALERARETEGLFVPAAERRTQALLSLVCADLELEDGNVGEATRQLDIATQAVGHEDKLKLHCLGLAARVAAAKGDASASQAALDELDARIGILAADPESEKDILSHAGMATCGVADWGRALAYWRRYLDLGPGPAWRPKGLYHLGVCLAGLGDADGATEAYREGAASTIPTYYARLAGTRLCERASHDQSNLDVKGTEQ